jgi:hypothetical protein
LWASRARHDAFSETVEAVVFNPTWTDAAVDREARPRRTIGNPPRGREGYVVTRGNGT